MSENAMSLKDRIRNLLKNQYLLKYLAKLYV